MKTLPQIVLLVALGLAFSHCGGPAEWTPDNSSSSSSSGGTNTFTGNACYDGNGTDSDGDGLSDECEENLGTTVNDPDCDDDGISDKYDNLNDCPGNEEQTCDVYCQAQKAAIMQVLANDMLASYSAMRQQPVSGYSIRIEHQILVVGPLNKIPQTFFTQDVGLSAVPRLRITHEKQAEECNKPNNIFFMANGTIKPEGSAESLVGTPVLMEFCGLLESSPTIANDTDASHTVTELKVTKWTIGAARTTLFDPEYLKHSDQYQSDFKFNNLVISDRDPVEACTDELCPDNRVLYKKLDFEAESKLSFFDETNQTFNDFEVETFSRSWKRVGNQLTQANFSKGFSGLWHSCSEFLGFGC